MQAVAATVRIINGINGALGKLFSWFPLLIVLICFAVVVMRYAFRTGSVPMQDLYIWLNGAMFMGIAGYALMRDSHVRVDIFYREARTRTKAIVDMIGSVLFVGPFLWTVAFWGWPYVARSWSFQESSPNMGGLAGPVHTQELHPRFRRRRRLPGARAVPSRRSGSGGSRGPAAARHALSRPGGVSAWIRS